MVLNLVGYWYIRRTNKNYSNYSPSLIRPQTLPQEFERSLPRILRFKHSCTSTFDRFKFESNQKTKEKFFLYIAALSPLESQLDLGGENAATMLPVSLQTTLNFKAILNDLKLLTIVRSRRSGRKCSRPGKEL